MILRVSNPPPHEFLAHGVIPVPVGGEKIRAKIGKADSVERVTRGSKWATVEVSAWVPGGTKEVPFEQGMSRLAADVSVAPRVRAFAKKPQFNLRIEGHGGAVERVDMPVGVGGGLLRCRYSGTVHTRAFGTFRWWTVAQAGDDRVWMTLRWQNSVDMAGKARPEFLFRSLSITGLPSLAKWTSATPDAGADSGEWLAWPNDHVFQQRGIRDFRLVFYKEGTDPHRSDGWGTGDWSKGGWGPAGFAVPTNIAGATAAVSARASDESQRFASFTGTGGTSDAPSLTRLWPYAGVSYGGMTGEIDIWPYDGCLTASTASAAGLQMHRILSQRYGCRMKLIFEADGTPVDPERHLIGSSAEWSTFDYEFQRQSGATGGTNDAPWEWDKLPKPTGPRAYTPSSVSPIDSQHAIRALKDAIALVWLDADPAAAEYVVAMAEMARMTFWTGPGRARRLTHPAQPGKGWDVGRAHAWAGHAVAVAAMLGRQEMREWCAFFLAGAEKATTPCGLFAAARWGKAAETIPMGSSGAPKYLVQRGNELSYFAELLAEFEGLGLDVTELRDNLRRGTRDMTYRGAGEFWDRHVVGTADGSTMYRTRADVPAGVYAPLRTDAQGKPISGQESWSYYSGNAIGSLGGLPDLMRDWGKPNGVSHKGAPIEVWLPALGQ